MHTSKKRDNISMRGVCMSLENMVKLLERLAVISDDLTKLALSIAILLFVYSIVVGK